MDPDAEVDWADPDVWLDPAFPNVYFQPDKDENMSHPCIVYECDDDLAFMADNGPYSLFDRYQVTLLDHDPDSPVKRRLRSIQHSSFSRHFATSGLNHDVFVIYH
jgi:hypothetical protein